MSSALKVAHILVPYIRTTESFIYERLTHHKKFKPIVITNEQIINLNYMPFSPIFSPEEQKFFLRYFDKIHRRIFDYSRFLYNIIKKENVSILHAHYGNVGAAFLPLKKKLKLPMITSFYGIDASALPKRKEILVEYQRLFSECELISVVSEDMKNDLIKIGCPKDKIKIHNLAIDLEKILSFSQLRLQKNLNFAPSSLDPAKAGTHNSLEKDNDTIKLISVGRLVEKKGMEYLIKAFSLVNKHHPNTFLTIIGDGILRGKLEKLTRELKLEKAVSLKGEIPRNEVFYQMAKSDIFVLASVTSEDGDKEGTPTVLIEAQALGLPCVSTYHAGIPELIIDGKTGYLCKEKDANGLSEKIIFLIKNKHLWEKMGEKGKENTKLNYNIKMVMEKIEADYLNTI